MSDRNATASWSGFSHQGLVGLYIALKELQTVNTCDYEKYFIDYEKKEDFAIYCLKEDGNKNYKSIHQVKAYSSGGHLLSKYKEVFTGKAKKDEDGNLTGKFIQGDWISSSDNYLHAITAINDWNDAKFIELSITNNFNIALYDYPEGKKYCDTVYIETLLKDELKKILYVENIVSPARVELAYSKIVNKLDSKIRYEHKTKQSKSEYDIKFSFSELRALIDDEEVLDEISKEKATFENRKYFYNSFNEYINDVDLEISESQAEIISGLIEKIYQLPDGKFQTFLYQLNLDFNSDHSAQSLRMTNRDGLEQVFFWCLCKINSTTPEFSMDNEKDVKVYYHPDTKPYVLTSILGEQESKVVRNILKNLSNVNVIWDNCKIINRNLDVDFIRHKERILDFPSLSTDEKERIMDINFSNSLISRENAKRELNDNE